jgi:hypothetical protein
MSDILNERAIQLEGTYRSRYLHKIASKPKPLWIQARRTFATAISVLASLDGVPFDTLVHSVYIYCEDSTLNWMTREYEKQVELAGANPERFVMGLHSFYNQISHKIRKNKLYSELMDFMGAYMELAYQPHPDVNENVVTAYGNLLMQTMEYIRPSKFNFTQSIIGVTVDGQPICVPQPYPNWDLPSYEIEDAAEKHRILPDDVFRVLHETYAKYGYEVASMEDLLEITEIQKLHDNTIVALMPYISEFTYDIFPLRHYKSWESPLTRIAVTVPLNNLLSLLKARKRTLPQNGTRIVFHDPLGEVQELLLKETVKHNAVIMLYRLSTKNGDVAGYFNTQTGFLYSANLDCGKPEVYHKTKKFLLYCYAVCVTNRFPSTENTVFNGGTAVSLRVYSIGGKQRAVYGAAELGGTMNRRDVAGMEPQVREIDWYIRKLPFGQKASEDAVCMARQMGYDLDPGETFVRPFCKEVFVKRVESQSTKPSALS